MSPPRLLTACSALPPEGAGLAWDGPALAALPPRLLTACSALPPGGAGLAWDGPALAALPPRLLAACSALPPGGAGLAWDGPALAALPPHSLTTCDLRESRIHQTGPRTWLCRAAGAVPLRGETHHTKWKAWRRHLLWH